MNEVTCFSGLMAREGGKDCLYFLECFCAFYVRNITRVTFYLHVLGRGPIEKDKGI